MKTQPPFYMGTNTPKEQWRYDTWDTKEPETLAWIRSFQPTDVFWDIGANIGVYSLYAAVLYEDMPIYAFEPVERNFLQLHRNKKDNEIGNRFQAMRYAIGNRVGPCFLEVPDVECGASGAQARLFRDACLSNHIEEVQEYTVDVLCEILKRPDHVKIDIDGQELNVILGMKKTLPHVKSILVEVNRESKSAIMVGLIAAGFSMVNDFNFMTPHSRERRKAEGIDAENLIFVRRK